MVEYTVIDWRSLLYYCFCSINQLCMGHITHCLIDLFFFVLRGMYRAIVDYGGNFFGENGGFLVFLICFNDGSQGIHLGCEVDFC